MRTQLTHHLLAALLGVVFTVELHAQTSAFTYQGRLTDNGTPANGSYDLSFELFDDPSAGSSHGAVTNTAMAVSDGLFTVQLDFGTGVFDGSPRWIEISVRHPAGSGNYTALDPRQEITPTPVAHFALAGNEGPEGPQGPAGDPGSDALWNVSGADMYYHLGHVGIGTQTPEYYLDVGRPARFSDNIGVGHDPGTSRITAETAGLGVAFYGLNHSQTPTALLENDGNGPGLLVYSTDEAHPFGGGAIQIGHNETAHLAIDRNEITTALGTGNATLNLNPHGGAVSVGVETATGNSFSQLFVQQQDPHVYALDAESTHATLPTILAGNSGGGPVLWAQGTGDADLSADGVVMVGNVASINLAIDGNEIMARDNGAAATLHLNAEGGQINMGQYDIHPAFAYGVVSGAGSIISSSANVTDVSKAGSGQFDIHFAGPLANTDVVVVTVQGIFFGSYAVNSGVLEVGIFDTSGDPTDPLQFSFLVYRP